MNVALIIKKKLLLYLPPKTNYHEKTSVYLLDPKQLCPRTVE
jgi:hypothetical protein